MPFTILPLEKKASKFTVLPLDEPATTPSDKPWMDGWDEVRASMQANERAASDMGITVYEKNLRDAAAWDKENGSVLSTTAPGRFISGTVNATADAVINPILNAESKLFDVAGEKLASRETRKLQDELTEKSWIESTATGVAGSLGATAVRSALGGPYAAIAGAMEEEHRMAYRRAKMKGATEEEATKMARGSAAVEGGIAALFQMVGLGGVEKEVAKGLGWGGVKEFAKQTAAELTEENLTTLAQNLATQGEAGSARDYMDTTVQTVLTMGLVGGSQKIASYVNNPSRTNARRAGIPPEMANSKAKRESLAEKAMEAAAEQSAESPAQNLPITGAESPLTLPSDPQTQAEYDQQYGGQAVAEETIPQNELPPLDIGPEPTPEQVIAGIIKLLPEYGGYRDLAWSELSTSMMSEGFVRAVRAEKPKTQREWESFIDRHYDVGLDADSDAETSPTTQPTATAPTSQATEQAPPIDNAKFIESELRTLGSVYGVKAERVNPVEVYGDGEPGKRWMLEASQLAEKIGVEIVWYKTDKKTPTNGFVNEKNRGVIFVDTASPMSASATLAHEAVHSNISRKEYNTILDSITDTAKKSLTLQYANSVHKWRGIKGEMEWRKRPGSDEEVVAQIMTKVFSRSDSLALRRRNELLDYLTKDGSREAALAYLDIRVSPWAKDGKRRVVSESLLGLLERRVAQEAPTSPVDASQPEAATESPVVAEAIPEQPQEAEPVAEATVPPVPPVEPPAPPDVPPTEPMPETAPEPPDLTSARKAWMAEDRKRLGLAELPEAERRSWETDLADAREQGIPEQAQSLAASIIASPRALTDTETAGLVVHAAEIKNKHEALSWEMAKQSEGDAPDSTQIAERERLEQDFDVLSQALKMSGTEKGRNLAAQKLTINKDYSLIAVKNRAKVAKKKPLAARESQKLTKAVDSLAAKERQLQSAIEKAKTRLADLEKHIEEGTLPTKKPQRKPSSKELNDLRDTIAAVRRSLGTSEAAQRARLEKTIARLEAKLKSGEFTMPGQRPAPLSSEIERLEYERDKLRREINVRISELRPKAFREIIRQPFDLARTIITSMDFPPVFRQGGMISFGNPVRAARATAAGFKAMFSEQYAHKILKQIDARPNAPLYARAKLYLADLDGLRIHQEEAYVGHLANTIPILRTIKNASERNYTVFLNQLRADTFDAMAATLPRNGEPTMEEARAIARYINVATGRGDFNARMDTALSEMAAYFFSPRYVASRFQAIIAQPIYRGEGSVFKSGDTRNLIAKEYGKMAAGVITLYALAALAGAELEDDGKLKVGDTRIDPMFGMIQTARLAKDTTISIKDTMESWYTGKERKPTYRESMGPWRFMRSKFSPILSASEDMRTGRNFMGKPTTPIGLAKNFLTPLSFRDIMEATEEQGVPVGMALWFASLFGIGLQTWQQNPAEGGRPTRPSRPTR